MTTVAEQYEKARNPKSAAERSRGAAIKSQFMASAAKAGKFYDAASIDYLRFERTDGEAAEVVSPRGYKVGSVDLATGSYTDDFGRQRVALVASLLGGEEENGHALAYPTGPGFDYSTVKAGEYWLTTSRGSLYAHWEKSWQNNDLDSVNDYWIYKRYSLATPADISGWNDDVETMGMRSYPSSSTVSKLRGWNGMVPSPGTFDGNCNGEVSIALYGVGTTYTPCEEYRVDWNSASPGDFSVNWKNAPYASEDEQDMAYVVGIRTIPMVPQPPQTQVYYTDYQYVNFMGDKLCGNGQGGSSLICDYAAGQRSRGCASTGGNANCG